MPSSNSEKVWYVRGGAVYGSTLQELLAVVNGGGSKASRTESPGTLLKLATVEVDPEGMGPGVSVAL